MNHGLWNRVSKVLPWAGGAACVLALGWGQFGPQPVAADPTAPGANDKYIARVVAKFLNDEHLTKHAVDDEMSQRCFQNFLRTLDPLKQYFLQSDVDEFAAKKTDLDDMIRKGDVSFGFAVFQRFLQRVDERVAYAQQLLDQDHDFTLEEELVTDGKLLDFAKDTKELDDRWRRRVKYDLLVQKSDKVESAEAKNKLKRRYASFGKRMHQLNNDDLVEMFLSAMTTGFDPHTNYMSASTIKSFTIAMSLKLEGIGAALQYDDGYTKITNIIPGGPADKDGRLKADDRVISVAQDEGTEFVDVVDMNLNDVVKMIRGKAGTTVQLKVLPGGVGEPKIIKLTRDSIELKDSEARSEIIEEGKKPNGQPFKIGVINLPSFYMDMEAARAGNEDYKSTTRDVKKLLDDFNAKGVDLVIMDLRQNGGGSLPEAISLTGLFIDQGPVVQVKDAEGNIQHYEDQDRGKAWNGPLVVLTSKFSASASEIFAGAIQDYGRGLIIGDKATHGKGTVQSLMDLGRRFFPTANAPEFGSLKITMQQFYRPNGDSTQNRGVLADVEIPSITSHLDVGESDLDYALAFDHVEPLPFRKENLVEQSMIDELRALSKERTEKSEDFQKEAKKIARYESIKKSKRVNLNEAKFLAEREEFNSEKEEEKEFEEQNKPNKPVVKRDYYFNEALSVALDYLRLSDKLASK
ncbi:MAG: carboxy terminal-processing peptidase [Pirellulales bacterium]|nr:carboxy terminal-processing peptidase [Pirellulales bacterium]